MLATRRPASMTSGNESEAKKRQPVSTTTPMAPLFAGSSRFRSMSIRFTSVSKYE